MALPALLVVLALAAWALSALTAQLRCLDASRSAARALARGDSTEHALAAAREIAPAGAVFTVERGARVVVVRVTARLAAPGRLPVAALPLQARAVAPDEGAAEQEAVG